MLTLFFRCKAAGGLSSGRASTHLFTIGLDALGGYVFARMAHNGGEIDLPAIQSCSNHRGGSYRPLQANTRWLLLGYDICPYNVAAAAGAVYGTITGLFHTILGCLAGVTSSTSTNGHYTTTNIFGTVSGYDPNWNSRNTFW